MSPDFNEFSCLIDSRFQINGGPFFIVDSPLLCDQDNMSWGQKLF